ncbi:unnamed protein product [marine sediment metagenome]|uniref:Uncharacterized protein n=1 Tax=marine sediment metagenome TaxID=412755 RepID=X1A2K9_9ZZZZ
MNYKMKSKAIQELNNQALNLLNKEMSRIYLLAYSQALQDAQKIIKKSLTKLKSDLIKFSRRKKNV